MGKKASATSAPWLQSSYSSPVWVVSDYSAKPKKIFFDWLLPDGTKLTDPENALLCETVKAVVFGMRSGPLATSDGGDHQAQVAAELRNLVCWMKLQMLQNFADLDEDDFREFFSRRIRGLSECLQLAPRVRGVLASYSAAPSSVPPFKTLLSLAGIDPRTTNLVKVVDVVDDFLREAGIKSRRSNPRSGANLRAGEGLAESTIKSVMSKLRHLWLMRTILPYGGLNFDPLEVAGHFVNENAGEARTLTIPQAQGMFLLDRACRWVLFFGPELLELKDSLKERRGIGRSYDTPVDDPIVLRLLEGEGKKSLPSGLAISRYSKRGTSKVLLYKAVNGFLPVACLIVIAVFTARRHSEILTIMVDSIGGSANDGYWLKTNIAKTLKRIDVTPCPTIVQKAVALLVKWSEDARAYHKSERVFLKARSAVSEQSSEFRPELHLNDFAIEVAVPALPDGTFWRFTPHQFRRLFAILYVWRYDIGDLEALSHQMRHFNIEMTRRYATDAEMGRMAHEEGRQFTVEKLLSISQADSKIAGSYGLRMQRHMARMRKSVSLAAPDGFESAIQRMVDRLGLSIRATPWGFCGCKSTSDALSLANCQKEDWKGGALTIEGLPDVSGSSPSTCAGCMHNMIDPLRMARVQEEIGQIDLAVLSPTIPPMMLAALMERRKKLQQSLVHDWIEASHE